MLNPRLRTLGCPSLRAAPKQPAPQRWTSRSCSSVDPHQLPLHQARSLSGAPPCKLLNFSALKKDKRRRLLLSHKEAFQRLFGQEPRAAADPAHRGHTAWALPVSLQLETQPPGGTIQTSLFMQEGGVCRSICPHPESKQERSDNTETQKQMLSNKTGEHSSRHPALQPSEKPGAREPVRCQARYQNSPAPPSPWPCRGCPEPALLALAKPT